MRKPIAVALILAVAIAAVPVGLLAAGVGQQAGVVSGVAQGANRVVLPNYAVQVRDVGTGQVAGTTTSSQTGTFSFAGLQPGSYVVEIVDAAGKVVGLSNSVAVGVGTAVNVTVTASTVGALASAAGGGLGLMGLGTIASVAVVGAAGAAAAVVAVKAVNVDASPAR